MSDQKVVGLRPSSHSCFYFETDNTIVTVYNKEKKRMRLYEINAALDIAKNNVVNRMRGKE
jgi:hypothetical protein